MSILCLIEVYKRWTLSYIVSQKENKFAYPIWNNLSPCESELFFNSCPRWKHREEFFTPNLCIAYIPTQLCTLPHILPQIHTLSKINTFFASINFPLLPRIEQRCTKKLLKNVGCLQMGDVDILLGVLSKHQNIYVWNWAQSLLLIVSWSPS